MNNKLILPILAIFCAGLLLWWAVEPTPADPYRSYASAHLYDGDPIATYIGAVQAELAKQDHSEQVVFFILAVVLLVGAWRLMPRRATATGLLLTFLVVGCASTQPIATTAPADQCSAPTRSSWWYAYIDDCPATADRVTWIEYYALTALDQIAGWQER